MFLHHLKARFSVSYLKEAALITPDPSSVLPHTYPFLLLDRVTRFEHGITAEALVQLAASSGAFPQMLLVESVAQLAGVVAAEKEGEGGFLASIEHADFGRLPDKGDRLLVTASIVKSFGRLHLVSGSVRCNDEILLDLKITLGVGQL